MFEELGDGFLVTMFRKPTNQTNQSKIIELLKVSPNATTKGIVKKLEITDNQVKYYIKKLKDDDKIERIGTNRKGSWRVK